MKRERRETGAGITIYEDEIIRYDWRDPAEARQAMNQLKTFCGAPFDTAFGPYVRAAERELIEYRAKVGPDHEFRPHDEAGWYCKELLSRERDARRFAEAGDLQRALFYAAHLGVLLGEARVKFLWEDRALFGQRTIDERAAGALAVRKWSAENRRAAVSAALSSGKLTISGACKVAAKKHPGKGSWKAFERDWYAEKKPPHPTD